VTMQIVEILRGVKGAAFAGAVLLMRKGRLAGKRGKETLRIRGGDTRSAPKKLNPDGPLPSAILRRGSWRDVHAGFKRAALFTARPRGDARAHPELYHDAAAIVTRASGLSECGVGLFSAEGKLI